MKRILLAAMVCSALSSMAQTKQNFNSDWRFLKGDDPKAKLSMVDDSRWQKVTLPHDWSIYSKTSKDNPMGNDGGYFEAGIGWYHKKVSLPETLKGKKILLYFEGVYMNSEVYVNGRYAGGHPYGYSSFYVDITPFAVVGHDNSISVKVDNSQQKNCRWYSGSGIYRNVWLVTENKTHIENIFVSTKELSDSKAVITVQTEIQNQTNEAKTLTLKIDKDVNKTFDIPAKSSQTVTEDITLTDFKTWTVENPNMTSLRLDLIENAETIDTRTQKYGIRKITATPEGGLTINGKAIILNGGCIHHDNGILGAAAYNDAEIRKVQLMKAAGFNAVRTSHNPPSETFLNACDSLGLLVIDEAFDGWYQAKNTYDYSTLIDKNWRDDLSLMIKRDRNHPSIFCYSIGNEILERKTDSAVVIAKQMVQLSHSLDPTRPVTQALAAWDSDWEIYDSLAAQHDIVGYNYLINKSEADHKRCPNRMIIQTESFPRDAYSNYQYATKNNYILGDFVWTAIDYLGESGIGRFYYDGQTTGQHWENLQYPCHGAYCGDIDLTGWRKPISHYRSMLYNNNGEKLYMSVREPDGYFGKINETLWSVWPTWESWNWPGWEGKDISVEVISKYPKVRLYLNNKLIGEKATDNLMAVFTIPYKSGTLKAEALEGSEIKETVTLKTASEPKKIRITADKDEVKADGESLVYLTVEIIDKEGNVCPNADNEILFLVKGTGRILSTGSADISDEEPYYTPVVKAYKGRALAVIRSKTEPGTISVTATSEKLENTTIEIECK